MTMPQGNKSLLEAIEGAKARKGGAIFLPQKHAMTNALYAQQKLEKEGINVLILNPEALYAVQLEQTDMTTYLNDNVVIALTNTDHDPLFLRPSIAKQAIIDTGEKSSEFYRVTLYSPTKGHTVREMIEYGASELRTTPENSSIVCQPVSEENAYDASQNDAGAVPSQSFPKDSVQACFSSILRYNGYGTDMEARRELIGALRKGLIKADETFPVMLFFNGTLIAEGRSEKQENGTVIVEGFTIADEVQADKACMHERRTSRQASLDM